MRFVLCILHKSISHRNKNTTLNKKRKGSSLKRCLFIYTLSNFFLVNDCYFPDRSDCVCSEFTVGLPDVRTPCTATR